MLDQLIEIIHQNVHIAPYIFFGLLLLAGFNLPVSEDAMLFIGGVLAAQHPEQATQIFIGIFLGAYFSDIICYAFMGRYLGPKLFSIPFFAKMASQERLDKISHFYEKYGVLTLIFGRFIPFGVRNALFISAGLGRMKVLKFCVADFIACSISCVSFFYLYYHFGEDVISVVKKGNLVLFSLFLVAITVFLIRRHREKSRQPSL
jgi:membrane protein DedA with SNARE-associated domain